MTNAITAVTTVNIQSLGGHVHEHIKINKLLVSPNKRLNNMILERTIEFNTNQPQNSMAKESNATSELSLRPMERKTKVHMAYSPAHMFVKSYLVPVY